MLASGVLNVSTLRELAKKNKGGNAIDRGCDEGRAFGNAVSELCKGIAEKHGFYVWGQFDGNRKEYWQTVYVGKAGLGKTTTLESRIKYELNNERILFWADPPEEWVTHGALKKLEDLVTIATNFYPDKRRHFRRAVLKAATTHIIWVSTPSLTNNAEVALVESDLIETLNPKVNVIRSVPTSGLQDHTVDVIRAMKREIHAERDRMRTKTH